MFDFDTEIASTSTEAASTEAASAETAASERVNAVDAAATRSLTLSSRWNIGENPNGGYLMAVMLRAMAASVDQVDPLTVTTHFLRPGLGDEQASVVTEIVKPGRSITVVSGTMVQREKERLTMLAGFGTAPSPVSPTKSDRRSITLPMPATPSPEACVDRNSLAQGVALPLLDRVDVRIVPDLVESSPDKPATMAGWIRFADGRPPDTVSLPLFADAFPPSLFTRFGRIGWVPTLEMTVQVRRRPVDGWIYAEFECDDLSGDFMIETGTLWDESGALVARSRQLGMLLDSRDA